MIARTISPAMTSMGSKRFHVSLLPYITALVEAAESILTDALQMAQKYGFHGWQSRCSLSLARLEHMKGDTKGALNAIFPVTQQSQRSAAHILSARHRSRQAALQVVPRMFEDIWRRRESPRFPEVSTAASGR